MAYIIEVFGSSYAAGVALPIRALEQPVGIGAAATSMIALPGGNSWDSMGATQTRLASQIITIRGGWLSATAADMTTKIDALRALVGTRNYLWTTPDSGSTKRSRLARCLDVRASVRPGFTRWMQVEMDFELAAGPWAGAAHSAESTTLDASPHDVATTNAGNARVRDAIITVRAVGTDLTVIGVSLAGKVDWHWTGTLTVGNDLVINCGTKRILNNGSDAYATFALQAGHADNDWLPLDAGVNTYSVHLTGGASSTFKLDYNDGWA
jgi:hypothetical protein